MPSAHYIQHHLIYLFLALIALVIVVSAVRSAFRKKKQHSVLHTMGFINVPREQVFANVQALEQIFPMDVFCYIPPSVGKGQTALGETVLFDMTPGEDMGALGNTSTSTVAGFRVNPALPDFCILHILNKKLAELIGGAIDSVSGAIRHTGASTPAAASATQASAQPVAASARRVPLNAKAVARFQASERVLVDMQQKLLRCPIELGDPAFSRHHQVSGSDEARVRAMLTPAFIAALGGPEFGNFAALKTGEWLFLYTDQGKRWVAPADYPHWLQRTVALAQMLNLQAP